MHKAFFFIFLRVLIEAKKVFSLEDEGPTLMATQKKGSWLNTTN